MSYLRTNYRITGKEIDIDAIGGGVIAGSWGGGAGTDRAFGGFIMGSFNGSAYATYHIISAYGAMSQFYGSGKFDSGYKIFPFMVKDASVPVGGTTSVGYDYYWSVSGSLINIIGVKKSVTRYFTDYTLKYDDSAVTGLAATVTITIPAVGTVIARNVASGFTSGESVHFVWAGWIVSGP
jgi:hypothetical protein